MPIGSVKLLPGINVERTATLNEAGYATSNLGRFKDGLFQKIGGWERFYPFNVDGIPRDLHAWEDLNSNEWLSIGTTSQLAVVSNGLLRGITPQTKTTNPNENFSTTNGLTSVTVVDPGILNVTAFDAVFFNTPIAVGGVVLSGLYPIITVAGATSYTITAATAATATVANGGAVPSFATTNGSSVVTVTLNAHGMLIGGKINFPIATTVGGVTITGTYTVNTVPTANTFTIAVNAQATATTSASMNAGNAQIVYYISLGPLASGIGYGIGPYGIGGYGSGVTSAAQTGTDITATDWTSDNWGEILLACPHGGGIYYWAPSGGFLNAALITSGPVFNGGIFVAMPAQILVAWGSTVRDDIGVEQDPLQVKWSDSEDFTVWTAASTNQAGSFRIPTGSRIVGGLQGPQQGLIWTDLDLWAMNYLGPPLVYGFNKIGAGAGLVSAHGAAQLGSTVYWMGRSNFFRLAGSGVEVLRCPVWDVVFQDLDTNNLDKCRVGANTPFNEILFFYPSASGGTGECDKYVKYNALENSWDYGSLPRSAWIDQSVLGAPIAASPQSGIFQHETTSDADGSPINAYFESGYFMLSQGNEMVFVDWMIPDFKYGFFGGAAGANIVLTIKTVDFPGDTPRSYGPFTVTQATQFVNPRARGRQMSIKVESNDVGSFWRLGNLRYRFQPDGRL